jgi:hypothetical protein
MNKLALTLCIAISTHVCSAQTFGLGPKVGMNISNYVGGNIESDALVGYHLGGMLSYGFGKVLYLQPEVLFSTQGAKIQNKGAKTNFKISYVTIPFLLKIKSAGGFFLELGPQAGFLTSTDIPDQTIGNFAKNLDLAAAVGLGYHSAIGLGVGFRYIAGLSKVGDFTGQDIDPDFRNSVIQASIFWAIPILK